MGAFQELVSLFGIGVFITLTLYNIVDIGDPSMMVIVMGPRPGNVAKGILLILP